MTTTNSGGVRFEFDDEGETGTGGVQGPFPAGQLSRQDLLCLVTFHLIYYIHVMHEEYVSTR